MTEGSSGRGAVGGRLFAEGVMVGATEPRWDVSSGPRRGLEAGRETVPGRDEEILLVRSRLAGHRTTDRRSRRGFCVGGGPLE